MRLSVSNLCHNCQVTSVTSHGEARRDAQPPCVSRAERATAGRLDNRLNGIRDNGQQLAPHWLVTDREHRQRQAPSPLTGSTSPRQAIGRHIDAEHVPLPGIKLDEQPVDEIVARAGIGAWNGMRGVDQIP
jgi:hypothetical protein